MAGQKVMNSPSGRACGLMRPRGMVGTVREAHRLWSAGWRVSSAIRSPRNIAELCTGNIACCNRWFCYRARASRFQLRLEFTQPHSRIATADSARCISLRGCVENRTVQRGCADSTVATVATHPVGEGGKRQRRLACYVHTVATA